MTLIVGVKDVYRQSVEAASGGKNTVMYDDKGNPSIMVCIPKFKLSDVIEAAPETAHPAFIVNGVEKNEIWISKYQNVVHDGRAHSLPGLAPKTAINFDAAKAACTQKGAGWHLMTNSEWAAIALWSKKNGTLPRGNNNYGADHAYSYEKILQATESSQRTNLGKTGTGPVTWSHDHTTDGIYDLNGNIWEWTNGLKIQDGRIVVMNNNDYNSAESDWVQTSSYFDDVSGLAINSSRTATSGTPSKKFSDLAKAAGHTIPELLKCLSIAPADVTSVDDVVYVNLEGERMAYRGGHWGNGAGAGAFALNLNNPRSHVNSSVGFRSALVL